MVYYLNPNKVGLSKVSRNGKGTVITLSWFRAFPSTIGNLIAYNIYMDVERPDFEGEFFNKSPSFVSIDGTLTADIEDVEPGQMYRFAVRPIEHDNSFDFETLPEVFSSLRVYPESPLREDLAADGYLIPLLDTSEFPSSGVIKIAAELIAYSSVDDINNNLVLTSVSLQRGFDGTDAVSHGLDGVDGYGTQWAFNGAIFWPIVSEDQNTVVYATENNFQPNEYAFTIVDGYRQVTEDIVNADLSVVDQENEDFPSYSYAGWHRTDPLALIRGECVGSYFGGEIGCADDGYGGFSVIRGVPVNDLNTQRQEILLSLTGEPVCLVKRMWTGTKCFCIQPHTEIPDARCLKCLGTGWVVGYFQFFNSRRSDGRIMMRFDPWIDQTALVDSGFTPQQVLPNGWTLVYPSIIERDFIVRFDRAGNEEFRYEILSTGRNLLLDGQSGAQKLAMQRIRKTDIIYNCPVFADTSLFPTTGAMTISSSIGVPPHTHNWKRNEGSLFNMNQLSEVSASHNHQILWSPTLGTLVVSTELGHTHQLIL